MATVHAQFADAGKYHLEVVYAGKQERPWEWHVIRAQTRERAFTGRDKTLDGAKKSAAARVGLVGANWKDVGPAIELEDGAS